jgi:LTXXQ motif family protein
MVIDSTGIIGDSAMTLSHRVRLIPATAFALALSGFATTTQAQPSGMGMGSDMMMGPGMMSRGMMGRMCGPEAAGFAEWRIKRIEEVIKPTDAQKSKLEDLKTASNKAAELMRAACPTSLPLTTPGRMEAMEKRMDAMLQAVKTVWPAMDAFYATLNDEQKKQLDSRPGRHRFWR